MNKQIMKYLDITAGYFGVLLLSVPTQRVLTLEQHSFLIIRPGGIGDAVLLAPFIKLLNKHNAQAHITIIAEQRNACVFALIPGIDNILCYDRPLELLQALQGRYDVVVDTEQWHRLSAIVARLVHAPVKIGFDTNERRRMFTHPVPYSHDDYEADSFTHLLMPLGINEENVDRMAPFLTIPESSSKKEGGLLEPLNGKPFVVIFPGASIAERRWGPDRFGSVAADLADKGFKIIVVGGHADRGDGELIARAGGGVNLAGLTSLPETAAVIAKSRLVVSGDSGVLHIAVGLDIPTVSLFGPGIAAKWAPRGDKHIVLDSQQACSPCTRYGTTPPCPHNVRCMKEITADQVVAAAVTLLQKYQK